ncbi:MAG: hypothetical protein IJ736_16560, partial [Firmicutes bacterium]|nr:hypothetical protein [Bacillota bacterium]
MKKSDENITENTAEEILEETMTEITECEPTETTEETESDVNDKNISFKEIKLPIIQITVILMLIASGFILYYILGPARCEFHSDCTDTLMWAQASYDSGKVFDPNFSYAALLPFSTGLIMQLFIGITGVSYTTHAIGMIGFFILFSLALIFMLRSSGFGFGECFFIHFLLMFLFSGSKKLREIFWGHTIYYSLGLLFLFTGLALLFGIINDLKNKKTGRAFAVKAVCLGALCILSSLNGIQALTIFILPMTGAVIGYAFLNFEEKLLSKENIELVMIAVFVLICAGIGLAVGSLLAKGITSGYEEGYSKFSSSKKWAENAGKQFVNWLTLAGVNVTEDDKITSIKSMKSIVIIFFNLLAAVIPVYRIFTYERIKRWQTKIFFIVHWACASLILIGCIFGKIGSANWRLTPIMGTAYIFFFMFVKELIEDKKYSRLGKGSAVSFFLWLA